MSQRDIQVIHADGQAQINQTCYPVFGYSAGHDTGKMIQIRFDIDRNTVKADPFAQADADGGDLVFGRGACGGQGFVIARHPDPDAAFANLSLDVETVQLMAV